MSTRLIALSLATFVLAGAGSPKDEPPKADKDVFAPLQGTWRIVGYAAKGNPIRAENDPDEAIVIKGKTFTHIDSVKRSRIKLAAEMKIDAAKKPAQIDFKIKGEWKGKEMEWTTCGIYSLKGDELTICVPEKFDPWEPENRPKEFKSTRALPDKNSGFSIFVLKKK